MKDNFMGVNVEVYHAVAMVYNSSAVESVGWRNEIVYIGTDPSIAVEKLKALIETSSENESVESAWIDVWVDGQLVYGCDIEKIKGVNKSE
jgi:hypothetical protein